MRGMYSGQTWQPFEASSKPSERNILFTWIFADQQRMHQRIYFLLFKDSSYNYRALYFLGDKYETYNKIRVFIKKV